MYFVLITAIVMKFPTVLDSYKMEGKLAPIGFLNEFTIESNENSLKPINAFLFPKKGEKSVVIFWASWCTPCKLELSRINKAIEEKIINPNQVYAISIDEDLSALKKAMIENKYKFKIFIDRKSIFTKNYKVAATPTVVLIRDDLIIHWMTSGVSPTLINRIENFLK